MKKSTWSIILDYIVAWTFALVVYTLIRNVGTIEEDGMELPLINGLLFSPVFGILFGTVFAIVQLNFERLYNKRTPIAKLFLIGGVVSFSVITLLMVFAYVIFIYVLRIWESDPANFFFSPSSFIFYGYIILVDNLLSVFRQVNLMLGPGVLRKLIKGQFYTPREEERVFMFLDLKSSTEMAEKLGHIQYSQMIQDCFDDLAIVTETRAEIYQYVGDEAVLTWPSEVGLTDQNCLHAYFKFKARIESRKEHYLRKYGQVPFFKAGMNLGKVTVAEVGRNKKEIAYHGDTINTAARIQGKCNELQTDLLISEQLKNALGKALSYATRHMGDIPLRGKTDHVAIYAVFAE